MKKKMFSLLALLMITISCGLIDSGSGNIEFDLSGAIALAGTNSSNALSASNARSAVSSDLVKILEDGSMEKAISSGDGYFPSISFISIESDGSVYICFEYTHYIYSGGSEKTMQLVRIYNDNSYDIIWPPDSDTQYEYGEIYTWDWYGMDADPLIKDPNGNIYFKTTTWNANSEVHHIWKYSPLSKGPVEIITPENSEFLIKDFNVDAGGNLYIRSTDWNGTDWMRCYPSDSSTFKTLYYTSTGAAWVRGFTAAPSGNSVIINGSNINGYDGIIKVTINPSTDPVFEQISAPADYVSSIYSMYWDTQNNLYGYSGVNSWGSSANNIFKLMDSNGNYDYQSITVSHSDKYPGKVNFIGDYMYYRYDRMNGAYETGIHKLARLNLITGDEEEILTDSFFIDKDLEILSYDVADDNSFLYFSALNYYTNEVIFGKINLSNMSFEKMDSNSSFVDIKVF